MIAELFTNNALNLVIIFGSCAALILMSFWFRRGNRKRKGFLFHAVQFLIYTIIISAVGSIINYVIENYKLKFITPGVIDFICTSLIAVILTIKLFLLINQFEKSRLKKVAISPVRGLCRVSSKSPLLWCLFCFMANISA